ncbi:MAG TPA: hypothetical protein VFE79_22980, partial [Paraburkholderia sp.]|nr:hypothetical protein [Paraburkholderia sp.]
MKETRILDDSTAHRNPVARARARRRLGEAWRTRAGAGAAFVTAVLLMSACADASSTTADTPSSAANPANQASPPADAVSHNESGLRARPLQDAGFATGSPDSTNSTDSTDSTETAGAGQAASASASRPTVDVAKAKQLAAERRIAARVPSASGMTEKRSRPLTLRDSGIDGSMMFARDVDFRVTGDIGFMIHDMAATLTPARAGQPIVFDDPTSLSIDVHRGDVTLDGARLTAIFDRYLFQYQGSPLRNMRVVPEDGGNLRITGEMHRESWVPIVLTGSLSMRSADELVFHPDHVEVAGVGADKLMQAAHVRMADLLKVDTPIARLDGDDVVMQVAKLTPPPALHMTITQIQTSAAGVRFTLDDRTVPTIAW